MQSFAKSKASVHELLARATRPSAMGYFGGRGGYGSLGRTAASLLVTSPRDQYLAVYRTGTRTSTTWVVRRGSNSRFVPIRPL
eukprot:scaffold451181_cov46-Prasinocladus_malaysianus.AAC.1